MGEEDFSFETHCGNVKVEATNDAMTPYGGLVPFASFLKKTGILESLSSSCPVERISPNASSVYDILCSLMLTSLCDGKRFDHVNRLRYDPVLPGLFGMNKVVSDDTLRRFLLSVEPAAGRNWFANSTQSIWSCLPKGFILDWDSTVMTKYGKQEGAEIGYNPTKRGRPSFHPLMAIVAGTRLCPYYRWRPGNTGSSSEWIEAMEECLDWLGENNRPSLNRGDVGFGNEKIMHWHETVPNAPKYLFKLKITAKTKDLINSIEEDKWLGECSAGLLQVTESIIELSGWSKPRRVILGRRLFRKESALDASSLYDVIEYKYEAYITDLVEEEANEWQIVELYKQRADCENVFDELKNQWGFDGFCSKTSHVTEHAARMTLITYNLWNLFSRLMEPGKHIEARTGRRWFLIIASRMVETAREKMVKISIKDKWKEDLMQGYKRIYDWLNSTAPQLISASKKTLETQLIGAAFNDKNEQLLI